MSKKEEVEDEEMPDLAEGGEAEEEVDGDDDKGLYLFEVTDAKGRWRESC